MYNKVPFLFLSCPCGWWGDSVKQCICAPAAVTRYQKRISGPMLDRIDIHIEVPRVEYLKLTDSRLGESSETIRARGNGREKFSNRVLLETKPLRPTPIRVAGRLKCVCIANSMTPAPT
jgi:magnesium chelatase family protein